MASVDRVGDLEIEQDLVFQRREWKAERVGWAALVLVVLAAVLGLFSAGPLSNATATDERGLARLSYDRFARYEAPLQLELQAGSDAAREGELHVRVSRAYLRSVQVESVTPEPASVEADREAVEHVFKLGERRGDVTVTFDLRPEELGLVRGEVALGDAEPLEFAHFVYP